jgi:hypothetical protein
MASKTLCRCGHLLRKNLYEGHRLHLLVPEELTDRADSSESVNEVLDELVRKSAVVMSCAACKGLTMEMPDGTYQSYGFLND